MTYDLIIIGMGISGISAAIYAKRANLSTLIIDKSLPGGLLNNIENIDNYPGYKSISGPDLAEKLDEQLQALEVKKTYEEVKKIVNKKTYKIVKTSNNEYKGKRVLIATGRSQKSLGLANEEKLRGYGISSCALCDANFFKDKVIAVVGGGNSALQEALYLAKIVNKIYLIHRRDKFIANQETIEKIKKTKNIEIIYNAQIKELLSENDYLSGVTLNNGTILKVKGLFVYIGFNPKTEFIEDLKITDEAGYILVNKKQETKIEGLYAAGDIVKKEMYQLITAASEGALAAFNIIDSLK